MTREEAVEVILAGGAWFPCEECKGIGKVKDEILGEVEMHSCGGCLGVGSLRNHRYEEAHLTLHPSHPYPERPLRRAERIAKLAMEIISKQLESYIGESASSTTSRLFKLFGIKEIK